MRDADRRPIAVVNAMTVDVEDYFHVSAFDGVVAAVSWDALREPRRAPTPSGCSHIFDEARRAGDVLRARLGRGAASRSWCGGSPRPATKIASHGYDHRLVYDQTPERVPRGCAAREAMLEERAGVQVLGYRAPSYSITPRSLWALDVLDRRRLPATTPASSRSATIATAFRVSPRHIRTVIERDGRPLVEAPGSTVRMRAAEPAGRRRRLLPAAAVLRGRAGASRACNDVERRPAVFYLHPWEIDPGSAAAQGRLCLSVPPLPQSGGTETGSAAC